jgi:acyl-CoA reductase-like NAD-dependent aldehyde dehydrogenase
LFGAFYQSGQSCIGVQRLYVHRAVYDEVKQKLVAKTEKLVKGDPKDEKTFIGPMISEKEAERLDAWIKDALGKGATLLCGGKRDKAMLDPTWLENAPKGCDLVEKEAFGPVACIEAFDDFDDALTRVNDSAYGLQAGVFTRDLYHAQKAWDRLEVGGVVIGDVPSWRVDNMPYGGVKDSGFGREGIRWAIHDMTEERLLVIRTPQ